MSFVSRQAVLRLWKSQPHKSLVALDIGTWKTGVAASKSFQPPVVLCTLESKPTGDFANSLTAILETHDAAAIVVGWPQDKPENLTICSFIYTFVKQLQQAHQLALPVCRVDESFSTVHASLILDSLSVRKSRNLLNQTAAAVILERYLAKVCKRDQSYHC
jgi:RNase H-fold protein (predicted Holliday junction resolvase)